MKVIFSHGKESGPWGSKIKALANVAEQLGCEVDSIDYSGIASPDKRVQKLREYLFTETEPYLLIGSSMGGYVSLVSAQSANCQSEKLRGIFLLAPALYMQGYEVQSYDHGLINVEIIHGWSDDVIPAEHSIKYAQKSQCSLHLIDGDHRLNSSLARVIELFRLFLKSVL